MSDLKIFTENVEEKALEQIHTLIKQPAFADCKVRIMPDCLTENTEILTYDGYKLITDLSYNDLIANYNSKTKKIEFKKPKNIIIREKRKEEKVFSYRSDVLNTELQVSENHRLAVKGEMGIIAKEKDKIENKNMIFNAEGLKEEFICKKYSDNDIRIIAWIVGDGNIKVTHNSKTDNKRIRFGLKKERKIERIKELLEKEKLEYKLSETEKQTEIMINTESSKRYIDLLNGEKTYPRDFMFLSKKQTRIFFEEAIQVDGDYEAYINNRGMRINSSKTAEMDIMCAMFSMNLGYAKEKEREIIGFNGKDKMQYTCFIEKEKFSENRNGLSEKTFKRKEIEYNGKLVCVTCDTGFFLARQNGFSFITGNCHAGAGCVIGFTADLGDKVIPEIVGVDIGCGMGVLELGKRDVDLAKLDDVIRKYVPSGMNVHDEVYGDTAENIVNQLYCKDKLRNADWIKRSLGTLGGGNHFCELDIDNEGNKYLIIHSGSRNLGKQVAEIYQQMAVDDISGKSNFKEDSQKLIKEYKENGRENEISKAIKELKESYENSNLLNIPKELCYLTGEHREMYLHDMKLCQEFAHINRRTMQEVIAYYMGWEINIGMFGFETIHNYIEHDTNMVRKGAISAKKGERLLIPMNMRDGCIIGIGKGNEDWNMSAPHGAGRVMSRSKAKESISLDDFEKSMEGIYTTSVNQSTIDESPMSYKPIDEILENIKDTVEIERIIKPIYNFKASE